jgi:hypothetical protein
MRPESALLIKATLCVAMSVLSLALCDVCTVIRTMARNELLRHFGVDTAANQIKNEIYKLIGFMQR